MLLRRTEMSSTFVADTSDDHKTDNTLIIIVNNDGTISVDQETLQNILANQQNTAVSVVHVGGPSQGDDSSQDSNGTCDSQNDGNPHVNLTVEGFYPPTVSSDAGAGAASAAATTTSPGPIAAAASSVEMASDMVAPSTAASGINAVTPVPPASSAEGESLDPFLEMDPEQLERLETALQSEQAKQILGENVTAMLDMLTVEEETTQLKDSILMDHCYTNRSPSTAPAAPPAVAPVITHQFTANSGRDDGGPILLHQADHIQQILPAGIGSPVVQTIIRGRGRGRPGRPRREGGSNRGATTLRGVARGGIKVQRGGTIVSGTGAGNMIMVQQIKQITPPLSAGGATSSVGASLVPLVRPLVIQSATSASGQVTGGTVVRTTASGQKQIIAVPQGARLITVQGKQGSTDASGQQTVLLTNAAGQVVHTQQIQGVTSVSSQLTNANNAKVVVAKMPPILPPHQFLGAQPAPITEQPTQHLQKEDESDFTDFPQEVSEESESEESEVGSDDEYKDPSVGRRGGRGSKGRGRFARGGRSRGGYRVYEGGRGGRGGRRGRGRGFARAEDMDRVKKLDAEMAGFVAAMEKSPETPNVHVEKAVSQEARDKHIKKEELHFSNDGVPESSKKKMLKVYGKSVKKTVDGSLDEVHIKAESVSGPEKIDKSVPPQSSSEKRSPVLKSPIKRHSPEIPPSAPPATQASPSTPTTPTSVSTPSAASDARKNYPKRENRKPPAHLVEALGPALFSTPDIIRRVSTGPDQKPLHESSLEEERKDVKPLIGAGASHEIVSDEKLPSVVSETSKKTPQSLPSDVLQDVVNQVVMDALQTNSLKTEDVLVQSLLVPEETPEEKNIDNLPSNLKPISEVPEPEPADSQENEKPRLLVQQTPHKMATAKPQTAAALKRSSRRRSSSSSTTQQNEKKEGSKNASMSKDKKRPDESKQKGRRRLSEVDEDDEDMPSSDDESWNSEDDPDRLWCICKKPHNNRFMICCDVCEDWFHGKCVGVTKAMGKQMENKGLEWSCPNCAKKKEDERESKKNLPFNQKDKESKKIKEGKKDTPEKNTETVPSELRDTSVTSAGEGTSQQGSSSDTEVMYCIVCKKEARPSSIYCGDSCILKHAQESLNCISRDKAVTPGSSGGAGGRDTNQELQPSQQQSARESEGGQSSSSSSSSSSSAVPHPPRTRPDARVIVFERKTGKLLAGPNAPTAGNLKCWLKDNPTFEVVRPGLTPTNKFYGSKALGSKIVALQSKGLHQKPVTQQNKVSQANSPIVSAALQTKLGTSQKLNVTPPKTIPLQQKSPAGTPKTVGNQQKIVTPVSSPVKVLPTKVHKGPIVVPPQPQKVIAKTSVKQPNISVKTNVKAPSAPKVPSSPSSKVVPPSVVSKAPATSTVKETGKLPTEKPVAKKVEVKRQSSSSSSETIKKEEEKEKDKPSGPEPIRLNVRKTLQELLQARIQECPDLQCPESEVQNIAVNIEEEMHSFFRDTGIKYKSKYRSLVFNIKDPKNLTLFRKIADKSLTPHQLVRLSPEELASQELAQWREREAKHQLEMIKKNELDLMSQAKTYVMKTHKGEQVIETDESLKVEVPELVDPATVPDLVSPVNNSVSSTVEDVELDKSKSKAKDKDSKEKSNKQEKERSRGRDRERSKHDDKRRDKSEKSRSDKDRRDSHHDRHDREKRRDSKERDRSKSRSRDKHRNSDKSKRDNEKHRDSKSSSSSSSRKEKKEEMEVKKEEHIKKENTLVEIYDGEAVNESVNMFIKEESKDEMEINLKPVSSIYTKMENQEDSDLSDREPSSTVTIKTPDINVEDHEKTVCTTTVWKGFVNMPDVAKFFTTVQIVSGDPQNLCKDLPDTVDIVGRIAPKTVWDYISKMKKTGTKEILVIRLTAANDEEKIPYITLYTSLSTRGRLGVVGNVSKMIKDFYIMPLASHLPVPQILLPLVGPGFEEYRPHLLIGILVRARRKRLAPENEYVAKMPKRILPPPAPPEPLERSYTPPLPGSDADVLGSLTPPHPPPSHLGGSYTPPTSPQAFLGGSSLGSKSSDPRLNRIDKDTLQEDFGATDQSIASNKQTLSSHVGQFASGSGGGGGDDDEDDDDAPYSPGGSDDDIESSEDNMLTTPKNPVELQRKVEELNRKIEEQKQQIESISCAIVASDPTVAALGTVTESLKVNNMMQNYVLGPTSEEAAPEDGDESEAYSPSRSFTPPSTSIPFIGPAEAGSTPVFSKLPSNINLPSNLHEILATIKKQESDKAAGSKGINLKADPIVQNYGKTAEAEGIPSKTSDDFNDAELPVFTSGTGSAVTSTPPTTSASILQSASSALLSLSTPVVHPLASGVSVVSSSVSAKVIDPKVSRDPRQRVSDVANKTSGSTLSTLSDDDLIKKALEMEMEMTEPKIKTAVAVDPSVAVSIPTLQQPLPPGVDSLPAVSGSVPPAKASIVSKSVPSGQPLPPGVEDEDYSSYSSFGITNPSSVIPPMNIPVPPYNMHSSNSPAPYHVSHPYPGASYNMGPARVPPTTSGYSSSFPPPPPPPSGYTANVEDTNVPASNTKRKFSDGESDESTIKRDRSDSPPRGSRETWDSKMPVPVLGRFSGRGRGFARGALSGQRGFVRPRGAASHPLGPPPSNRSRWDNKDGDRKRSRYESGRSDWEAHGKDFDEKHRERSREGHHRDRSREKEKSSSQRSHSTRSSRSRDNEKGSDSP